MEKDKEKITLFGAIKEFVKGVFFRDNAIEYINYKDEKEANILIAETNLSEYERALYEESEIEAIENEKVHEVMNKENMEMKHEPQTSRYEKRTNLDIRKDVERENIEKRENESINVPNVNKEKRTNLDYLKNMPKHKRTTGKHAKTRHEDDGMER